MNDFIFELHNLTKAQIDINSYKLTAEKQLKLLKLLIKNNQLTMITVFYYKEKETYFQLEANDFYKIIQANSFEESLIKTVIDAIYAQVIKSEDVKKILESER